MSLTRTTRPPIPILLTIRKLDWGGIERDVTKLVLGFDRSRFVPHVAVYQSGGLRSEEVERAQVPVLDLEVASFARPKILKSALRLSNWIREKRIQVVHAFDASAIFTVPVAKLARVPLVLSSTLGSRSLFDPRTRKQIPWTDRMVDGIVVNCEAMRRHMMDDYGVPRERTLLCYNGVDTTEFYVKPGLKPDPVANASLVIGAVCVLRPEKRMEMLIEAFASVQRGDPSLKPGLKLLIVGSGPELPKLQSKAAELKIESDCIFMPAVPLVAPYLRAIDIFVSCSYSEAFSNSILEAMACGCCPVGTRVGGTPELIEDGERGLLFESGNVAELAGKLSMLVREEALRKKFAANAAWFAATKLNMRVALDRMSQIYEEGLTRKGRLPS